MAFSVAAYTDVLDGQLARKSGDITSFGKVMDPIADKLMVAFGLIILLNAPPGLIATWMALIIIVREAAVGIFRFWAAARGKVMDANKMGKSKALSQIGGIIISLLLLAVGDASEKFFSNQWLSSKIHHQNGPIFYLILIPVIITLVSGLIFFYNNRKLLKEIVTA